MTSSLRIISTSESVTFGLGKGIGQQACPGDVVQLIGPLGAGKTQWVKGMAEGLGIKENEVRSPTFTLMHVHDEGRLPLYHIDLYRWDHREAGLEEAIEGNGVAVVEWADEGPELFAGVASLRVSIQHFGEHREIQMEGPQIWQDRIAGMREQWSGPFAKLPMR